MKRLVVSTSRRDALRELERRLKAEGKNAQLHKDHNCVDVFDDNNELIQQQYVEITDNRIASTRNRYKYVGPGNGDYVKVVKPVTERDYTPDNPYIKDVIRRNR